MADGLVILGEVHTSLLHNSAAVSPAVAERLLTFVEGEQVRRFSRPIAYAQSPEFLTGLDCVLPSGTGSQVRAVGTAVARANLVGGHVLQGSTYVTVGRTPSGRRLPWSHYLSRRGVIEPIGRAEARPIVAGFLNNAGLLNTTNATECLDLAAISARVVDRVQQRDDLDRRVAFKSERTALRWIVTDDSTPTSVTFAVGADGIRRVAFPRRDAPLSQFVELCEDLAVHDWLLTTLTTLVQRSRIGANSRKSVMDRLRPAVDHLLHLWMPAARADDDFLDVWQGIEARPGFSRQWQVNVDRVRDQMSLSMIEQLGDG